MLVTPGDTETADASAGDSGTLNIDEVFWDRKDLRRKSSATIEVYSQGR
jgi:hypothetical protein